MKQLKNILPQNSLNEVKVIELFDQADPTKFPQKITLKNSNNEIPRIIDSQVYKQRNLIKKIVIKFNELIIIPLAFLAVLIT